MVIVAVTWLINFWQQFLSSWLSSYRTADANLGNNSLQIVCLGGTTGSKLFRFCKHDKSGKSLSLSVRWVGDGVYIVTFGAAWWKYQPGTSCYGLSFPLEKKRGGTTLIYTVLIGGTRWFKQIPVFFLKHFHSGFAWSDLLMCIKSATVHWLQISVH